MPHVGRSFTSTRNLGVVLAIAVAGATLGAASVLDTTPATAAATAAATGRASLGVTRSTVTVAGIVGTDEVSVDADLGAQARLARANRGKGVAGRTVEYLRTEPAPDAATADAAATKLAAEVFAVVPAVGPSVGAATLAREGVPFFGAASTADWYANRTGFGFTGVAVNERTRVAASPLGVQLRTVLGGVDAAVQVFHDDDATGAVRATQARRSLRAAGFRDVTVLAVPLPPAAFAAVPAGQAPPGGAAVLLTTTARTVDLAGQLVAAGSTATIVVGPDFYAPTHPERANGLTVLTPVAPLEERTAANRRLAADVEAFAPGTAVTPAIAAGYWSADLFVTALGRTGRQLTRARLLDTLNGNRFTYEVASTVGRSTWPEMHSQPVPCGSLAQSDGTQYLVVAPLRCAPAISGAR
ncbi:MAG TPA: ABC transporter substrate-binding protein [Acidimicrobiia bacterium]|nr:ABC transporter substrate-binding protein [Acidimicrobiia bacterium]